MVRDIRGAAERGLDQFSQVVSRRMSIRTPAKDAAESLQEPPQNLPPGGFHMQTPRRGEIPPATLHFDQVPAFDKVDNTVTGAINSLLAADSVAKRVAAESRLRRTLQNDQRVATGDLIQAKRDLSERLADLHDGESPEIPDQKTFDVYMMVLRQLDSIIERRTLDMNRG